MKKSANFEYMIEDVVLFLKRLFNPHKTYTNILKESYVCGISEKYRK